MINIEKLPDSVRSFPEEMLFQLDNGRKELLDSPIGCVVVDSNRKVKHLREIYGFRVKPDGVFGDLLPSGISFADLFADVNTRGFLRKLAGQMFDDVDTEMFYAPYIPLTVLSDSIVLQSNENKLVFNANGTVTIAEFLDCLNAVRYGCNSDRCRKKSLDNVLSGVEFFSEGYNSCIKGVDSPFYNLYSVRELFNPITRIEAAYILVVCRGIFGSICDGVYDIGINFNWECPNDVLQGYDDGFRYKVSCSHYKCDESGIVSINARDYFSDCTFSEFIGQVRTGFRAVPMPMFMSLVELGIENVFYFQYPDGNLNPFDELSRGELCYLLSCIAEKVS